jgi:hypothetical protein
MSHTAQKPNTKNEPIFKQTGFGNFSFYFILKAQQRKLQLVKIPLALFFVYAQEGSNGIT